MSTADPEPTRGDLWRRRGTEDEIVRVQKVTDRLVKVSPSGDPDDIRTFNRTFVFPEDVIFADLFELWARHDTSVASRMS